MPRISISTVFKTVLVVVTVAFGVGALEIGLRIYDRIKNIGHSIEKTQDPILGTRILPNSPGHDANGYRNDTLPESPKIVVLGDSQTWGVNVESKDAWPQALQRRSANSVYNMGFGGYGPVQYAVQTEMALGVSAQGFGGGVYFG